MVCFSLPLHIRRYIFWFLFETKAKICENFIRICGDINRLDQETKKDWTTKKLTPCKSLKAKSSVIVKLLLLKKTKDIFDVGCLEINISPPPKYVSV